MIPPPSVSHLRAGGSFFRLHLLAFLDFYFFYYSHRLRTRGLALRTMKKPQIGSWVHAQLFAAPPPSPPRTHRRLIISSTASARIYVYSTRVMSSQSLSEAGRSFENQLPSVCSRTDKVTCLLTNWPTSWQPELLPTTWPIFLVVDMSSCNWAVNSCCACSTA